MGCWEHSKEFIGKCGWCGKALCRSCVGKQEGLKIYCKNCSNNLSLSEVKSRPLVKNVDDAFTQTKPSVSPRPMMSPGQRPAVGNASGSSMSRPGMQSSTQDRSAKKSDDDYYELDGYRIKRPIHVEKPRTIERELPSSMSRPQQAQPVQRPVSMSSSMSSSSSPTRPPSRDNSASKHALNFIGIQQSFDSKQVSRPEYPQSSPQSASSGSRIVSSGTGPGLSSASTGMSTPSSSSSSGGGSKPTPAFMSKVSESTSRSAAQSALHFIAEQAKETQAKKKE